MNLFMLGEAFLEYLRLVSPLHVNLSNKAAFIPPL